MANEKRLIDANALQLEPDHWGGMNGVICVGRSGGKTMATVQAALKRMIDNAPTVDAMEVVHGRWIKKIDMVESYLADCTEVFYECSVCESANIGESPYCPNCGAKMDGGNEDG